METKLNVLTPANALSRNIKTNSKELMREFRPLDTYDGWVTVPMNHDVPVRLIRQEVKEILHEQIDAVIPNYWVYRRCVEFKEIQQRDTLERQITWLYRPNLRIIESELEKIIRRLSKC